MWCQNYFYYDINILFVFLLLFSYEYAGIFQRLHDIGYCNRFNAKADMGIQLSSVKLDIAKIYKTDDIFLINFFLFYQINLLFIKYLC